MPKITISSEVYTRLVEFKQVVEGIIDEEISIDTCVDLILGQGMDSMLADLLSPLDSSTLLRSFQQLGSQYPAQVYRYVAEMLKKGAIVHQKEEMKKRIGFQTQANMKR